VAPLIAFVLTVTPVSEPVLMVGETMRGEVNVGCHKVTVGATVAQISVPAEGVTVALVRISTGSMVAATSVTGAGVRNTASKR
jgi:predicted permease